MRKPPQYTLPTVATEVYLGYLVIRTEYLGNYYYYASHPEFLGYGMGQLK